MRVLVLGACAMAAMMPAAIYLGYCGAFGSAADVLNLFLGWRGCR